MKIDLKGKRALVGGSSKGLGLAVAKQLASSGAQVTLMARDENKLKIVVNELNNSTSLTHNYLIVDFNDFKSFKNIISDFFSKNEIDILINNTQGPPAGDVLNVDIDDYQKAFDLLFKNIVYTTMSAIKNMHKNKWGRIINIASISVKEPLNYLALSNTLRAALVTWAKSLSVDIAMDNISINNILTGYFDTERIKQLNAKKAEKAGVEVSMVRAEMEASVPMKRIGNPEELANLACFLASDQASYITGTNIPIDGGLLKSL